MFDAIERIEIGVRTRLIYYPALRYGNLWFEDYNLCDNQEFHYKNLEQVYKAIHESKEIFIEDHKRRFGNNDTPDVWKAFEVLSLGTLSKLYKNMKHQLPEKAKIATSLGLENHSQLSSWLEEITTLRNIIAHHLRLWNRKLVKSPKWLGNPKERVWLSKEPEPNSNAAILYLKRHAIFAEYYYARPLY